MRRLRLRAQTNATHHVQMLQNYLRNVHSRLQANLRVFTHTLIIAGRRVDVNISRDFLEPNARVRKRPHDILDIKMVSEAKFCFIRFELEKICLIKDGKFMGQNNGIRPVWSCQFQ